MSDFNPVDRDNAIERELNKRGWPSSSMNAARAGWYAALDAQAAEIERLRAALLVMRGRLLLENPHAVTTEADELLTPQKEQ